MAKYTSGKQRNLKVGLTSYSEDRTSLEVVGKVGIGTTNATSSLHVIGDQNVTGVSTLGKIKISSGIVTSTSGVATFFGDFVGTASTASFATTAFSLNSTNALNTRVGFATTAFDVIGGIGSISQLSVSGVTTVGSGNTGIIIDGTSGIITSSKPGITTVTFVGNLTGTASTASFATTATNVINGIASINQLNVSGFSTVGVLTASKIGIGTTNATSELFVVGDIFSSGIATIGTVKISSGIITSTTGTGVTFVGDLKGNSDTTGKLKTPVNIGGVPFDGSGSISLKGVNIAGDQNTSGTAGSADNLSFGVPKGIYFRDTSGTNATTSNNFTFDGNNLKVSGVTTSSSLNITGVSTFGVSGGSDGVVIRTENGAGIVTSSNPGVTTVTFYGTLIGTAQANVENVTNTTNVIGGIASVNQLSVSGFSTVGVLTATKIGIGTTNPTSELWVNGNVFVTGIGTLGGIKIQSGIITSTSGVATFFGNFVGTASTASFATTAFNLDITNALNTRVGFATTASNVIGGIASVTDLRVTGVSTFGDINSGVVIKTDNGVGVVTSSSTGVAVSFFGNFVGTATSASFATKAFNLEGFTPTTGSVGFASTATNLGAGNTGSLPYQKASGITTFLDAPTSPNQILLYDTGNGKPKWGSVSEGAGFSAFSGITVIDETTTVGTSGSITTLTFVGSNIKATATTGSNGISTITVSDNLVGTALSISGISTFGNSTTGIKIDGSIGIITSTNPGVAITFFGNLSGTASTASFATTAFNLDITNALNTRVGFATTAFDVIGGIGSISQLSVSGVTTVGSGNTGVVIDGTTGIITSLKPGISTVTYFGDGSKLTGIKGAAVEFQASTQQTLFPTLASNAGVSSVGISTSGSVALAFIPSTGSLGIGSTNPTSKLTVDGNAIFGGTGVITATEYNGNLKFGTPTGTGFKTGAVTITSSSNTKDAVNEINFVLGKLVPKAPATIAGVALTLTSLTNTPNSGTNQARLCDFSPGSPINNDSDSITGILAGTLYFRNTDNTITTVAIQRRGPGDSGTVTALLNSTVGVGTTTLSSGSNNGTYGSLVISNDQDAVITGITSGFYEVYDVNINNAICPDGFNSVSIRHVDGSNTYSTTKPFWYEDGSTISSPILTSTTPITPSSPVTVFSSGIPHYTESASNAFSYDISCQNATGEMYTKIDFLGSNGATAGFSDPGSKLYTDFVGGTNPPKKDFGVGTPVSCTITQRPRSDVHTTVTTDATKFTSYTALTPYGTGSSTVRPTITQSVNIMGTSPTNTRIDENNMTVVVTGGTNFSATRVGSGTSIYDTPVPISPTWVSSSGVSTHEAVVRGGVLRHDVTNYSTGFLPSSIQNYSVGRSGNQYFQVKFVKASLSGFSITVNGSFSGCWVCLVDNQSSPVSNQTWVKDLEGNGGWGDMLQRYKGSGVPTSGQPGCASQSDTVIMTNGSNNGTFNCTFGAHSSGTTGTILVRWKLTSGQQITSMSFTVTA
jgi:hypothetical protein